MRNASPSRSTVPNLASQMRVAFASMAWNTGSSSPGELLMTRSTSEVAVCCSSASASFFSKSSMRASYAVAFVPGRTKIATLRSAFRPLARQGHLVGTVTGPLPVGASQGSSPSILTEPHDELGRSFDHLVGAGEQRRRHVEAEHPGGLEIDHQLELAGLHDRQIGRLRPLEDAAGIEASATIRIRNAVP